MSPVSLGNESEPQSLTLSQILNQTSNGGRRNQSSSRETPGLTSSSMDGSDDDTFETSKSSDGDGLGAFAIVRPLAQLGGWVFLEHANAGCMNNQAQEAAKATKTEYSSGKVTSGNAGMVGSTL